MSDFNVKFTIRNNRILRAIKDAGFKSQAEFARAHNISLTNLNALVAMRTAPILNSGRLSVTAQKLCDELCLLPEDLWSDQQMYTRLKRNTSEVIMSSDEVKQLIHNDSDSECPLLPDQLLEIKDDKQILHNAMKSLSVRERKVLNNYYFKDMSLGDIASLWDVSYTRIDQIREKALRKLRRPSLALGEEISFSTSETLRSLRNISGPFHPTGKRDSNEGIQMNRIPAVPITYPNEFTEPVEQVGLGRPSKPTGKYIEVCGNEITISS